MSNTYYKVVYDDIIDLQDHSSRVLEYWRDNFTMINQLFANFLPASWEGAAADSINAYMKEVHGKIIEGFDMLMEIYERNYLMYKEDYLATIDDYEAAVIPEDELEDIVERITRCRNDVEDTYGELEDILASISDIISISAPSIDELIDNHWDIIRYVQNLDEDIAYLEGQHCRNDFTEFDEIEQQLNTLISECMEKMRDFKQSYVLGDLGKMPSYEGLNTALDSGRKYIESTQERYEAAKEAELIRIIQTALEEGEEVYLPYKEGLEKFGEIVEIAGEICVTIDRANVINNATKDMVAYIEDGFYLLKEGDYIYVKGKIGSASAIKRGIRGTRYAVNNLDNNIAVGQRVSGAIAGKQALNIKTTAGKIGWAGVGLDVAGGVIENVQEGAEAQEYVVDAVVDGAFAAGNVWTCAAAGAWVGTAIPIPVVGTVVGAMAGIIVGAGINYFGSEFKYGTKTAKDWAKTGIHETVDKVQEWYAEEGIQDRAEKSHKK